MAYLSSTHLTYIPAATTGLIAALGFGIMAGWVVGIFVGASAIIITYLAINHNWGGITMTDITNLNLGEAVEPETTEKDLDLNLAHLSGDKAEEASSLATDLANGVISAVGAFSLTAAVLSIPRRNFAVAAVCSAAALTSLGVYWLLNGRPSSPARTAEPLNISNTSINATRERVQIGTTETLKHILSEASNDINEAIAEAQSGREEIRRKIICLTDTVQKRWEEIHQLQADINVVAEAVAANAEQLAEIRREHEEIRGQHEEIRGQHEEIRGQHEVIRGQHEVIRGQHEEIRGQHEVIRGQHEEIHRRQIEIGGDQDRIAGMIEQLRREQREIDEDQARIAGMIGQLREEQEAIRGTVQVLTNELSERRTEGEEIQAAIAVERQEITNNRRTIEALNERAHQLINDRAQLLEQVQHHRENIELNNLRIADLRLFQQETRQMVEQRRQQQQEQRGDYWQQLVANNNNRNNQGRGRGYSNGSDMDPAE